MLFGTPSEGYMQQTVYTNQKCDSCLWFDRQGGKHGLCEKGLQPVICGDGMHPEMGFWPLSGAGHHNLPLIPITPPVGTGPSTEGLPESVPLEQAIAKYDKVIKSLVERQATLIRSFCRAHSNYSGMAFGSEHDFAISCTCEKINLFPIAKALYEQLPNRLRAAVEDEDQLQEIVYKAMTRVYASPAAASTPPAYLPGVHSPDSPVRPGKKKQKKLVKGFADLDKSIGSPSDPTVARYHNTHEKVLAAAKEAHAAGAGIHGADPSSLKLRLAAKEHGVVGQQFDDHPGHAAAAKFHYDRAAKYSSGKNKEKGAYHALAAQAIAHYHENQLTKAFYDSDIAKSALTDAAKYMNKLGVRHDSDHSAAKHFREQVNAHVKAASKHKDFPGYEQAAHYHAGEAFNHTDPALMTTHSAVAMAFRDHARGLRKSEEDLEKADFHVGPVRQSKMNAATKFSYHEVPQGRYQHASHGHGKSFAISFKPKGTDEMQQVAFGTTKAKALAAKQEHMSKLGKSLEKATNQPHMPDALKSPAKNLHALKPQKITIASDHPAAMALRTAAKDHVASTFSHFGADDHARHSAAHREMAMASKDSPDQAAHDALAAAHVTYGKIKNHTTYKQPNR